MDNPDLSVIQAFLDNVQNPGKGGQSGQGNKILQQGIITAIDTTTHRITVTINNGEVKGLGSFQWPLTVGDVVWMIVEGRIKIILGKIYNG